MMAVNLGDEVQILRIAREADDTTANWQSGVATSGGPGADLVTITVDRGRWIDKINVTIGGLTVGATITLRGYTETDGVEEIEYRESFVVGTDPDSIPMVMSRLRVDADYRVEVRSNNVLDDGATIPYEVK